MANTERFFAEITGLIVGINYNVIAKAKIFCKVRVAIGEDEYYDVTFFAEDWAEEDPSTGEMTTTAPMLFSKVKVGNMLTIGGVVGRTPATNGVGWLTARRFGWKNGKQVKFRRIAQVCEGDFTEGNVKRIAVVEAEKRRSSYDSAPASSASAPTPARRRPKF